MIKYITVISKDEICLNIMGRTATFTKDQEVTENAYTKAYPQYFKRIGEITGFSSFLATPLYVADPIQDFLAKEKERKKYINIPSDKVLIKKDDEVKKAIEDSLAEVSSIEELFDVKIETD